MENSFHANVRSRQRGISNEQIDLIINFGERKKRPGGAYEYQIRKRDKDKIISDYKHKIHLIEKSIGKAVVTSDDDETVITTYPIR